LGRDRGEESVGLMTMLEAGAAGETRSLSRTRNGNGNSSGQGVEVPFRDTPETEEFGRWNAIGVR